MDNVVIRQERNSLFFINVLSVIVPLAVAVMLSFPNKLNLGDWTKNLSHAIGLINTATTFLLIAGLILIKQNKINYHRIVMTSAFVLGGLFLVCYIIYHISNPANRFSGEGFVRYVYFFILITHIGLSLVVLPFVLRAVYFAATRQFSRHKSVVRYAYPIWLYVSATGVAVYLMLYHLFPAK
jgi:putative membrane protein